MSNVNQLAARVPCAAGSNTPAAVSKLHWHTYYYLCWVALGDADTQAEFDLHMDAHTEMELALGFEYLGNVINICEN